MDGGRLACLADRVLGEANLCGIAFSVLGRSVEFKFSVCTLLGFDVERVVGSISSWVVEMIMGDEELLRTDKMLSKVNGAMMSTPTALGLVGEIGRIESP